jgi:integrating conjugative element protein (TIGR03759 family)
MAIKGLGVTGLAMLLSVLIATYAYAIDGVDDAPVVYSPTTSTESLLERYSEVHSKPNEYWQLTSEEWNRYQVIVKKSPWAHWENHATPLALLAHYANSLDEKRRYARIEAELDTWRQYRVTEFQALYDKERNIVQERYVEWFNKRTPTLATLNPHDKLRLFVRVGDCDVHCRSLVTRVLQTQAKTDIFVVGARTEKEVFSWAEQAHIPVERVKTKEITLNYDNGVLNLVAAQLHIPAPKVPSLFRQAKGGDQVVAI